MRAREFIVEGGNVQIGDKEAQRMDLTKLNRDTLVTIVNSALASINSAYQKMFSYPLWSPELLASGQFLSGSSLHFFDVSNIPTSKFVQHKPTVGDIDTQVDKNFATDAAEFLTAATGRTPHCPATSECESAGARRSLSGIEARCGRGGASILPRGRYAQQSGPQGPCDVGPKDRL